MGVNRIADSDIEVVIDEDGRAHVMIPKAGLLPFLASEFFPPLEEWRECEDRSYEFNDPWCFPIDGYSIWPTRPNNDLPLPIEDWSVRAVGENIPFVENYLTAICEVGIHETQIDAFHALCKCHNQFIADLFLKDNEEKDPKLRAFIDSLRKARERRDGAESDED